MIYKYSGCSGLTSITLPSSVTSLGYDSFTDCSGLETVYFKGKVPKLSYSYSGSGPDIPTACIIKVPTEYLQDYKDAFGENLSNVLKQKEMKPWQLVTVWNCVPQPCRSDQVNVEMKSPAVGKLTYALWTELKNSDKVSNGEFMKRIRRFVYRNASSRPQQPEITGEDIGKYNITDILNK